MREGIQYKVIVTYRFRGQDDKRTLKFKTDTVHSIKKQAWKAVADASWCGVTEVKNKWVLVDIKVYEITAAYLGSMMQEKASA